MRLDDWLRHAEARLTEAGIESARMEAQILAAHVLREERVWVLTHPDHEFNELAGETLLQRREAREPLAYIVGHREFFGRPFGVEPGVLIPRHETETLIEAALELPPARFDSDLPVEVLDLGTGSGVLAVSLKLERPEWEVTAVDISPEALAIASANARFHHADIRLLLSDGFGSLLGESFDLIVSNPPYIAHGEELMPEVGQFEPALALYAGETGLEFYERISREAPRYLTDSGAIMLEVGHTQASDVADLLTKDGWTDVRTREDLSGTPRVVTATWSFECVPLS